MGKLSYTQAEIRALFVYERATGMLRRRDPSARQAYPWYGVGKRRRYLAFRPGKPGMIYLHQAVFLYHRGYVPEMLDHRNGDTRNCRIGNLRECSNAQNQYNGPRKVNNQSGYKGVVFHKKCKSRPWQAKIAKAGKVYSLGYYATAKEAAAAYEKGAKKIAGEFARSDDA